MLPREFLERFGRPSIQVAQLTPAEPLVIIGDPDRNLLAFWATNNGVNITPEGVDPFTGIGFPFASGQEPFILTHALHASLVNTGFTVTTSAPNSVLFYFLGTMKPEQPITRKIGKVNNAATALNSIHNVDSERRAPHRSRAKR